MNHPFSRIGLGLFLTLALVQTSRASFVCAGIHSPQTFSDSSVELELPLNEKTIRFVTTTDGTLGALFKSNLDIPFSVRRYLLKIKFKESPMSYPFESLPDDLKVIAAQAGIRSQKLHFGESAGDHRKIPGLQVKKSYQESEQMMAGIDMAAPATALDGKLIEFHVRAAKKPGEVALQAARLERKMGFTPGPMHMHVVFKGMIEWLKQNPTLNSWRFVEYWRRLNLTMEMRDVVERGVAVIDNVGDFQGREYVSFGPLRFEETQNAFRYVRAVGRAMSSASSKNSLSKIKLGSESKMGWVGFWGHDKYDAPNLFGFEMRFLEGSDLPANLVEFLNSIHGKVENKQFGLSPDELQAWMERANYEANHHLVSYTAQVLLKRADRFPKDLSEDYLKLLSPHRSYEDLFEGAPEAMKHILRGLAPEQAQAAFEKRGRLRYLLHDWSMDPVLYNQPELLTQIRNAQLHALRQWAQGKDEKSVVQEFLIESGLYQAFADSVGFRT